MEVLRLSLRYSAKKENIFFREKASDGIWVAFLLPIAIILGALKTDQASSLYISCTIYSFNLLLNVILLFYHIISSKSLYVTKRINILCAIPSSFTIFFYVNILQLDFRHSLCYTVANALIYFEGLPFILKVFPNSFTFGEGNLVIQGLSIFLYSTFTRLNHVFENEVHFSDDCNICTTILQAGILGMLVVCIVPFIFRSLRNAVVMYIWMAVVIFGVITATLNYILTANVLEWLFNFFFRKDRFFILGLWLACCVMTGIICWHRNRVKIKANTIVRKYFHILANVVFVSGVFFDVTLLYFASGCAFAVFVLLEIFRIMKMPPLYEFLQLSYKLYADEKDSGIVALTPIYLLIGYSIPLWIHPLNKYSNKEYIQLLSGVLSIGIGDTCASVFGMKFGKRHWKGTRKTVEGTIGCIGGQAIFILFVIIFGNIYLSTLEYFKLILTVLVSSLAEALTDQIDNIVLPLIVYILLMI